MLSSVETIAPGQSFWVALRLQHEPQWHTYWRVPGDSGLPTEIVWQLPAGWKTSEIHWPQPQRISYGDLVNYGVPEDALLLVQITPPATALTSEVRSSEIRLNAQARWLICREVCIPGEGEYQFTVQVGTTVKPSIWEARLQRAHAALPQPLTDRQMDVRWSSQGLALRLHAKAGGKLPRSLSYFPYQAERIVNALPQKFSVEQDSVTLLIPPNPANTSPWSRLQGLLVANAGDSADAWSASIDVPIQGGRPEKIQLDALPQPSRPAMEIEPVIESATVAGNYVTLLGALIGAFLGGLILNLMPCVFPVLSIKILAALQHERQHPGTLHRHGVFYALGVLLGFTVLALLLLVLRAAGNQLGWGFHLQNPWVVLTLAVLFTLIACNLLGWFEIRWGQTRAAQAEQTLVQSQLHPNASALLTGLLAVVVASPCSAPFMGAALGFALTQSALLALLVFVVLGLGLATPYLLLCFMPGLLKHLPKSGQWMQRLKQWLALPMLLTVAWLLWVYALQTGLLQNDSQDRLQEAAPAKTTDVVWQPYSERAMQTALAQNKTVLVDFTAAWCVTCQINKRLVLESASVKKALRESGVVLLRADWTRQDPVITAALQRLGRNGVPVYWMQRPGAPALLLTEVLTVDTVLKALQR